MGNTVTREIDASSSHPHHAKSIRSSHGVTDRELLTGKSGSSISQRTSNNGVIINTNSSTPSHSQRHSHHHHGSGKHKSSKKRNTQDYEMITDLNETVDGGHLFPQGVYPGPHDFNVTNVREAILRRKMAPFYKGLDSVEPEWTDEELLEKVVPEPPKTERKEGQPGPATGTQLIWLYRNTHECPICFLVYPRLNSTRCCGQGICTECFVQIKRNPPHPPYTTNDNSGATDVLDLLSEPAACPYCAQPDLGITFEAPPFEWGIPCPHESAHRTLPLALPHTVNGKPNGTASGPIISDKPSEKTPLDFSKGLTIDMIRPDWEEKLASARRRLARKEHAARMLHQSALLPNNAPDLATGASIENTSHSRSASSNSTQLQNHHVSSRELIYSQIGNEYGRRLTTAQVRALEQKMIDEAIRASLMQ